MKRNNTLRMKYLREAYLLPLTLAALSGCTPYSESFDCPPGRGVGCKSLNVINQMVEEGKLPLENNSLEGTTPEEGLIQAKNTRPPHLLTKSAPQFPPSRTLSSGTHMKVWMAAYEDESGVFHEASQVYVALKKGSQFVEKKLSQVEPLVNEQ